MNLVKGYRNVVTQGTYMGEEGTGYGFGELQEYGDFGTATCGHLQGYTEPCEFEIMYPGAYVGKSEEGELYLFPPRNSGFKIGTVAIAEGLGLDASRAMAYKFIRLVEE